MPGRGSIVEVFVGGFALRVCIFVVYLYGMCVSIYIYMYVYECIYIYIYIAHCPYGP